jgi:hypothetical protein
MKKFTAIVLVATLVFGIQSCTKVIGDGPVVSETRVTREFSQIEFSVPGEMTYVESNEPEIEIKAQRNIIDVIETYVSGDELRIRVRHGKSIRSSEDIRIIVKGPGVRSLFLSGSGRLTVNEDFNPDDANLFVSGSGRIRLKSLNSESLEAHVSGSGSIEIEHGSVERESIAVSGSGDVRVQPVVARRASTHTSGSGNIYLHATEELEVRISGSGDVFYEGTPRTNVSVSGSGRLVKL